MNWKRYHLILVLPLVIISFPNTIFAAQAKIQGDYCYQYGDSESLMAAKEISYAMALRKAIETYKTFVASTSVVQDFKLRKDLVETIASGYVENIEIIKQDVRGRTVCTELTGYVNPDAVKSIIARKVAKVEQTKKQSYEGIVSNSELKILNYKRRGNSLEIIYQAKGRLGLFWDDPNAAAMGFRGVKIIVHCFDDNGVTMEGKSTVVTGAGDMLSPREVRKTNVMLPLGTASFEFELGSSTTR